MFAVLLGHMLDLSRDARRLRVGITGVTQARPSVVSGASLLPTCVLFTWARGPGGILGIDRITRGLGDLAIAPSRRAVSRAAVGFAIGSILASLFEMTQGEAKKKHKKKRNHSSPSSPPSPPPPCTAGYTPYCDCCCDSATNQVCKHPATSSIGTCLNGGCPVTGLCTDPDVYFCSNFRFANDLGCWCTTGIGLSEPVCIELDSPDCNKPCTSSSQCGPNGVCVAYGDYCYCDDPAPASLCATRCGG
jgi:hypothetical protein